MVAWWWIPITLVIGLTLGVFVLALFAANDYQEQQNEARPAKRRRARADKKRGS